MHIILWKSHEGWNAVMKLYFNDLQFNLMVWRFILYSDFVCSLCSTTSRICERMREHVRTHNATFEDAVRFTSFGQIKGMVHLKSVLCPPQIDLNVSQGVVIVNYFQCITHFIYNKTCLARIPNFWDQYQDFANFDNDPNCGWLLMQLNWSFIPMSWGGVGIHLI